MKIAGTLATLLASTLVIGMVGCSNSDSDHMSNTPGSTGMQGNTPPAGDRSTMKNDTGMTPNMPNDTGGSMQGSMNGGSLDHGGGGNNGSGAAGTSGGASGSK